MEGESNDDVLSEEDDRRNKAEAGIARGAVRSMGRSVAKTAAKLPAVGRLPAVRPVPVPRSGAVMPRRLPVKQVAKISDRMSQGLDLYDSVSSESTQSKVLKLTSFVSNLVKNTLLGLAVFETYCTAIDWMAPTSISIDDGNHHDNDKNDPYAWASVTTHAFAGSLGGCAHGVAGTLWDTAFAPTPKARRSVLGGMPRMLLHHGVAHSVLFSGFEGTKRIFLSCANSINNDETHITEPITRIEYLGCVAVAGGFAGQAQHLVSHYSEQVFLPVLSPVRGGKIYWTHPTLRPLLVAFIPSSIAFVALEYGRNE